MKFIFTSTILFTSLLGCAQSPTSKQVDQDVASQPARPMHGGVARKGFSAFANSESLSADQKSRLTSLQSDMAGEIFSIQEETSKLKGVLFEAIASSPYDVKKVKEIKKRLVSLNQRKMESMFSALDKAEAIIGHGPGADRQRLYQTFFHEEMMSPFENSK